MEVVVLIVGGGPGGLATSVCLNQHSIPNVVLEKEDVCASLWKKRAYDRLKLHLHKDFCELPFMPHDPQAPMFMPKDHFIDYLDRYVDRFNIRPKYSRTVESASFDASRNRWRVEARNTVSGETEVYVSEFLVVATGENGEGAIPEVKGMETYEGEILHSGHYKNGSKFKDRDVLVVGSGNSSMEISFDLANFGAHTTIAIRNPRHWVSKEAVYVGMSLLKHVSVDVADSLVTTMSKITYGDLSEYGLIRPEKGPFSTKFITGKAPVIDVGTIDMIRSGKIKVIPSAMESIEGKRVKFKNGVEKDFDVILFATGYQSLVCSWLKNYKDIMGENGFPKKQAPDHWKGERNLYCVGFSRKGIAGVSEDAVAVADDIKSVFAAASSIS